MPNINSNPVRRVSGSKSSLMPNRAGGAASVEDFFREKAESGSAIGLPSSKVACRKGVRAPVVHGVEGPSRMLS